MQFTEQLINDKAAFDFTERQDELFLQAMREAWLHHYKNCLEYRSMCDQQGYSLEHLAAICDVPDIPWFFVPVLKRYTVVSAPPEEIELTLTSSGTSGEKSAIYLDAVTLRRIRQIVFNIYGAFDMVRTEPTNYLCFTYDPEAAKDVGTAWSDKLLTGLATPHEVYYAIRQQGDDWHLDKEACWEALERFRQDGRPLRILGFPSFTYEVIGEYVQRTGRRFNFGPNSYIITGGGWKTLADREIPRHEFKRLAGEWLGMPADNVRDLYGMVEHGVPYCECEAGRLHVPIYARAYARHAGTLSVLPPGEPGLLQFVTPYLHSFPAISLLTTDVGRVELACPCGRKAPTVKVEGRAGQWPHRGCALAALDILKAAGVKA